MIWAEAVDRYLRDQDLSPLTVKKYQKALAEFYTWYVASYREQPEPAMLTNEEAREWAEHLRSAPKTVWTKDGERETDETLAPSTINSYLTALRRICRHYNNPIRVQNVRQVIPPIETLTARERGRLVRALRGETSSPMDLRNVAVVSLMVRAGLRLSEVIGLKLSDIEIKERSGWVTIRAEVAKGRKERKVPLSREARYALTEFLDVRQDRWPRSSVLFPSRRGKPLNPRVVQRMVSRAAVKAGIDRHVTPHMLRHTFATEYLRKAKDVNGEGALVALATLQRLLGHSNIATTSRYLHPTGTELQNMIEEM